MMNLHFKISRRLLFSASLALFSLAMISCDRYEYPLARAKAPANAPEYSVNPDINKSPAVVEVAPAS